MLIDLDLFFDDLVDYAFFHKTEVESVIGDRVKCVDGEVLDFYEDVEHLLSEFDDIVVLRRRQSLATLIQLRDFVLTKNLADTVDHIDRLIDIAKREGEVVDYIVIVNDSVMSLHKFSY